LSNEGRERYPRFSAFDPWYRMQPAATERSAREA
jgi:hypothetical protein